MRTRVKLINAMPMSDANSESERQLHLRSFMREYLHRLISTEEGLHYVADPRRDQKMSGHLCSCGRPSERWGNKPFDLHLTERPASSITKPSKRMRVFCFDAALWSLVAEQFPLAVAGRCYLVRGDELCEMPECVSVFFPPITTVLVRDPGKVQDAACQKCGDNLGWHYGRGFVLRGELEGRDVFWNSLELHVTGKMIDAVKGVGLRKIRIARHQIVNSYDECP
jgi:hypothetical protein